MFLFLVLGLFIIFDIFYLIRGLFVSLYARFKPQISLLQETTIPGICFTTDLDFNFHMNNARYLRECDFGRFDFWIRSRAWQNLRKIGGHMTNGGNNIRYRKSLLFLDRFDLITRIIYWDEKAFYMEQKLVRKTDQFICCIVLVKQTIIGATPSELAAKLDPNIVRPSAPEELVKWLESTQISSEKLRKST